VVVVVGGGSVVVVVVVVGGGTVVVDAGQVAAVVGGDTETAITVGPTVAATGDGDGVTTTVLVGSAVRDGGLAACEPGVVVLALSGNATRGPAVVAVEPFTGFAGTVVDRGRTNGVVVVVEVAYWSADTDEPTFGGRFPSKKSANPTAISTMATRLARQCSPMVCLPLATA
jgi:hypothetical protein